VGRFLGVERGVGILVGRGVETVTGPRRSGVGAGVEMGVSTGVGSTNTGAVAVG
jgi:hypothetical protein